MIDAIVPAARGDAVAAPPPTTNLDAHDHYLLGLAAQRSRSAARLAESVAQLEQAVALDPSYAQILLAVDRGNEEVADWFRSLHPAVLQSIKRTLDAARQASIPAVVCGEMASTPAYAVVLIGLGAIDLSMTAYSIPRVRRTIESIKYADAKR